MKTKVMTGIVCLVLALVVEFALLLNFRSELRLLRQEQQTQTHLLNYIQTSQENRGSPYSQETALLYSFDVSFGTLNNIDMTVPTHICAVPKVLRADTQLSLTLGEETFSFTREGDSFLLDIPLKFLLHEDYPSVKITLESQGTRELEAQQIPFMRSAVIPTLRASMSGQYGIIRKPANNTQELEFRGSMDIFSPLPLKQWQSLRLILSSEGEILLEKDVTQIEAQAMNQGYGSSNGESLIHSFSLKETVPVQAEQTCLFLLQGRDEMGLVHQYLINAWIVTNNSELSSAGYAYLPHELLYSPSGELLFLPDSFPKAYAVYHP